MSCDDNYVMPLTVCLTSLFENNKDSNFTVFIFHSGILPQNSAKIDELSKKYSQKILLLEIDDSYFKDIPTLRWTRETYYRLLINELLPENVDRLLYLDCDILVLGDLKCFYYSDFDGSFLMALEENGGDDILRLELKNDKYFQAGVLLFDVINCRKIINYEKAYLVAKNLGDKLLTVDQDIINVIFDGKIKPINSIYNDCKSTRFNGNNLFNNNNNCGSVILHYATGKPWNNLYSGFCENVWYNYLKISPYSNLYYSKFNKFKYKIIRLFIFKWLFYKYTNLTPYINKVAKKMPSKWYNYLKNYYRKNIK